MASPEQTWQKFLFGGMSCMMAASITNPIDVIKIRLQIQGEAAAGASGVAPKTYNGFFRGMTTIVQQEGIAGLYKGLPPSLLREGSYSTIRVGMYDVLKDMVTTPGETLPLWKKILSGATSGAIGSAIANPTDLVKVRLQAEGQLKPGQKPRYTGTINAFTTVVKEEGIVGLWKGVGPSMQRATILTAAQLPSYDWGKHWMLDQGFFKEDAFPAHVAASMFAGLVTATATSPVDLIKTRMMNQPTDAAGKGKLYPSSWQCLSVTVRNEGLMGLYKGWLPNYLRIGPHTLITFIVYEQLRKMANIKPV